VLALPDATLREVRASDAHSLFALLTAPEVTRFIAPPAQTLKGFAQFIAWSCAKRAAGEHVCFGILPRGSSAAVGLIQICAAPGKPPQLGGVLGSAFWGSGLFRASVDAVLDFAFHEMGLTRVSAFSAVANTRGNAALRKMGAVLKARLPAGPERSADEYYWVLTLGDRRRAGYRIAGGRP